MKRSIIGSVAVVAVLSVGLLGLSTVSSPAFAQTTASQDVKDAGQSTKDAGKSVGSATKKTASAAGKKIKKGTHKAAKKVEQKTN